MEIVKQKIIEEVRGREKKNREIKEQQQEEDEEKGGL